MPHYQYKGRNNRGAAIDGNLDAVSMDAVANQLLNSGITPIDIREAPQAVDVLAALKKQLAKQKPKLDDLILFSQQMYTLMHAGVPITRALTGLSENVHNQMFAEVLRDVVTSLESGHNLSGALRRHPKVFSHLFISMIQIGESTGLLDEAFLRLAAYLEQEKDIRDRVKTALRYPVFVLSAIVIAMAIINIWVIPTFASVFSRFGAELPLPTKILLATSNFTVDYWYLMLGVLIGSIGGFTYYIRTYEGRLNWDRFKLRMPIVGSIILRATLARFSRAFSMAQRAGVPLIQALAVVSNAVDNAYVGEQILKMRNGIERGDTLTRTAANTEMFTPLVLQMLAVGEETGAVDDMLEQVAEFYERQVDYDLKNLSAAIEPIMIVAIGIMVLILALGVFLPMWDLSSVMR